MRPAHSAWVGIAILVASGASPACASARTLDGFGLQAGSARLNRSLEDSDLLPGRKLKALWGWAIGGYVQWRISQERISLSTEAWWIEKAVSYGIDERSQESTWRDSYMSLPILMMVNGGRDDLCPYAIVGPSFEYSLNEDEFSDEIGRWNIALNMGGGVRWRMCDIRMRYAQDITDSSGTGPSGIETVRNHGIIVSVGARFPLRSERSNNYNF